MTGVVSAGGQRVPKGVRIDGFLKKSFAPNSLQLTVLLMLKRHGSQLAASNKC